MAIRIFFLPCKTIANLHELPTESGVYYMTAFWRIFYVGQAQNLRKRVRKSHQRYKQLKILAPFARVHYKILPVSRIGKYESLEIKKLKPDWNYTRVPQFWELMNFSIGIWLRVVFYTLVMLILIICLILKFL